MSRFLFTISTLCAFAAMDAHAQKGRDLKTLDACKLLPGSDVATTAKGKLATPQVGGEVHCGYFLQLPNKDTEQYDLYLTEAAIMTELLKVQNPKGTPLPGIWDEAYVGPAVGGSQLALIALKRGDMAIEIQGPRKDVIIALGRMVVGRIK